MITTARKKLERDLANLIKAIAFWDIHIENYRIGMAENQSFNVDICFSLIDTGNKQFIMKKQLHQFMSSGQLNCSHKECEQLISQYFKNDQITFEQFREFILPHTNDSIKQYHINNINVQTNLIMIQFNRESLLRYLERILTAQRELTNIRIQIHKESKMDIYEIWKLINEKYPSQSGNLTEKAIKDFVESNGSHFNHQEFQALLRQLGSNQTQDFITQSEFNQLIIPPLIIVSNQFNNEIQERIRSKYQQLGLKQPDFTIQQEIIASNGLYNFRKVFDPIREGRPQFEFDSKYMDQFQDYKNKYLAPSRNYELQYHNNPTQIKNHDFFFQQYYLNLHQQDQEELYFNRFGKRYAYS